MTTMTVEEVTRKVVNKDPLFILDVRNESDFENWRIEGQQFDYLNVPYFELTNGVEAIVDKIPTDQDVLVVCAKGRSSLIDRKSTRLNSSHVAISYAVFCLK